MINEEQLKTFYEKFLNGRCSREELSVLLAHFEAAGENTPLRELIKKQLERYPLPDKEIQEQIDGVVAAADRVLLKNKAHASPEVQPEWSSGPATGPSASRAPEPVSFRKTKRLFTDWKRWAAAASIAFIVTAGAYTLFLTQARQEQATLGSADAWQIRPGGDRALLTLGDGTVIDLEKAEDGPLSAPEGTVIDKGNGQLVYRVPAEAARQKVVYNTITTPRGGQYEVVLPDGSHAWLNAGSSLHFPTAFTGGERSVEITGEVYFEVTSNKQIPFSVTVPSAEPGGKDLEVTVLGTKFNVMAYAEEAAVETTLLEGVVEISRGKTTRQLKPGLQAVINTKDDRIDVRQADLQRAVAWKEGRFEFNDSLQEIMRQIARWYDVEVEYQGDIGDKSFIGAISRKENVREVLRMLELTGGVRFEVSNRTIRVMPSK